MRDIVDGVDAPVPSTIEDAGVIDRPREVLTQPRLEHAGVTEIC